MVTERLYGDDKVKFEIIFHFLNVMKKLNEPAYDEFVRSLSEGNLDEYIMGYIEFIESIGNINLKILRNISIRPDIEMSEFKKIREFCKDENLLYLTDMEKLDKNSTKKFCERLMKHMNS